MSWTVKGTDELQKKISTFGKNATEISKKAVAKGVGIVADQVRKNLEANLQGSIYSKGDLINSLGITPIDSNGNSTNAKVGFDGYDSKGVANQLKARAMESGTSRQRKEPFVRPAVNSTKKAVVKAMNDVVEDEIRKTMR